MYTLKGRMLIELYDIPQRHAAASSRLLGTPSSRHSNNFNLFDSLDAHEVAVDVDEQYAAVQR
ncbi:hypothetical protein BDZ89DRAFT_1072480 [Hymenopellis radicata]|nr:hypothetical protein BDZ89DRAFT_1072480 [Hymenopellis radicata]